MYEKVFLKISQLDQAGLFIHTFLQNPITHGSRNKCSSEAGMYGPQPNHLPKYTTAG